MPLPDHPDFSAFELGRAHDPVEVATSTAVREACIALIHKAHRELAIVSRHLDPVLFDNQEAMDALREFVLRSRRTRVRILVRDPEPALRGGNRLVELAQRLSSFVEIRVPAHEFHGYNAAFLAADGTGIVYRTMADRFEATVAFGDRHLAGEAMRQFDSMWETSQTHAGLRRMHL
jgi:phosphatidylserine/phosphatidylglycerophosphate/cardiolipin synthase-like enzyme